MRKLKESENDVREGRPNRGGECKIRTLWLRILLSVRFGWVLGFIQITFWFDLVWIGFGLSVQGRVGIGHALVWPMWVPISVDFFGMRCVLKVVNNTLDGPFWGGGGYV